MAWVSEIEVLVVWVESALGMHFCPQGEMGIGCILSEKDMCIDPFCFYTTNFYLIF